MKSFIVTESRTATVTWTYFVEAENEEEAIDKIEDINPDNMDFEVLDEEYHPAQYEVEEYDEDDDNDKEETE